MKTSQLTARFLLCIASVGLLPGAAPTRDYSTYFGGSGIENVTGMAVDAAGNVYLCGWTDSPDLNTLNAYSAQPRGSVDAFVIKLDPNFVNKLPGARSIPGRVSWWARRVCD
jgi:hypothetical protein